MESVNIDENYAFKFHIYDKLDEINKRHGLRLLPDDVIASIMNGELVEIQNNDDRGRKYIIEGYALDHITLLEIICRIEGKLLIITIYKPYF